MYFILTISSCNSKKEQVSLNGTGTYNGEISDSLNSVNDSVTLECQTNLLSYTSKIRF